MIVIVAELETIKANKRNQSYGKFTVTSVHYLLKVLMSRNTLCNFKLLYFFNMYVHNLNFIIAIKSKENIKRFI